jgi:hypothetical protein
MNLKKSLCKGYYNKLQWKTSLIKQACKEGHVELVEMAVLQEINFLSNDRSQWQRMNGLRSESTFYKWQPTPLLMLILRYNRFFQLMVENVFIY